MDAIKLALVDDHTLVTDGISALLLGEPHIRITGSFTNSHDFFRSLPVEPPDVVLLDISLPGTSGIEIVRILKELHPGIKALMLSALQDEATVREAIRSGALGFLPKETDKKELVEAIETVYGGQRYFGAGISRTMFNSYVRGILTEQSVAMPVPALSEREKEVVGLFAEGLLYKEIADRLQISIKTVEAHKANIMRKLEIRSTAELVKYAIRHNLTELYAGLAVLLLSKFQPAWCMGRKNGIVPNGFK